MQTRRHFATAIEAVTTGMNVSIRSNIDTAQARKQAAITLRYLADSFELENPKFDRELFAETAAMKIGGNETYNVIMDYIIDATKANYND